VEIFYNFFISQGLLKNFVDFSVACGKKDVGALRKIRLFHIFSYYCCYYYLKYLFLYIFLIFSGKKGFIYAFYL